MTSERHDYILAVERTKGMAGKIVLCVIPASISGQVPWDFMRMQSTVQFCLYCFIVQNPVNAWTA